MQQAEEQPIFFVQTNREEELCILVVGRVLDHMQLIGVGRIGREGKTGTRFSPSCQPAQLPTGRNGINWKQIWEKWNKLEKNWKKNGRNGVWSTIHDLGIPPPSPPPNSRRNSEGGEGSPHISCFKLSESCKIARTYTWTYVFVSWYHYCEFFSNDDFPLKVYDIFFLQRHLVIWKGFFVPFWHRVG